MPGVDVGTLNLALTAPASLRRDAAALRRGAEEGLVPATLRAMERRLTRHFGEKAVIHIRSLDLRLRLGARDLAAPGYAEALGEDIADQVRALAVIETAGVRSRQADAQVRVWISAHHLSAARLAAAARREAGPEGVKEDLADVWPALAGLPPGELAEILDHAAGEGELPAVLARLAPRELSTLRRSLPGAASSPVRRAVEQALARHVLPDPGRSPARRRDEGEAGPPQAGLPADASAPDERDPARQSLQSGNGADAPRPAARPEPAAPIARKRRKARSAAARSGPPGEHAAPAGATPAPIERSALPSPADAASAGPGNDPERESPAPADQPEIALEPDGCACFPSDWCGLGYLVSVAVKTELPEALWQIGLDEGAVLAHAFARIAGASTDPATRLPSRRFPEPPPRIGRVQDWAREELVAGALARAEPLAGDQAMLCARIESLVAEFTPGGAFAVDAWLAAYLLAAFEAMTGIGLVGGALDRTFARPGRVEIEDETVRIVQPLEAIDIDIRRAGLDADPGWLPWLEKRMVFVFEAEEGEQ